MPGNPGKKKGLEGSLEVGEGELIMHGVGGERKERRRERAKPCSVGD